MVFQILNKLKWNGRLGECIVTMIHRGAPGDVKEISGGDITAIKKSYFSYQINGRETSIPLHRVTEIKAGGETAWKRNIRKE